MFLPVADVDHEVCSCIAHNTQISNRESVILHGLAPGGDGITEVVHSQLSAFHMEDDVLQESSRASTTDAVILYSFKKTKPLLNVTISGVLATRQRIPGTCYRPLLD